MRYRGYIIVKDDYGFAWRHPDCTDSTADRRIGHEFTVLEAKFAIDRNIDANEDPLGGCRSIVIAVVFAISLVVLVLLWWWIVR